VTITALIADDEEAPRAELLNALHTVWPDLDVVGESANGVDAWDAYLQHEPQVCFLDVRMPGLTGVEVAQRIGGRSQVIFITAHSDHALAAFDAGAVDYLVKPVSAERLEQAVQRVKARLAEPTTEPGDFDLLDRLAGQVRRPDYLDLIETGVGGEVSLVRIDDVVFFESEARYTRVVHRAGDALIRTPLKELASQLDPAVFVQVHRSVIVNRHHIASAQRIDEDSMVVTLRGRSEKLPVSRHFQGLFSAQ